ncbi:MAG: MFS transporter [Halobacteriovoraceae bacterium]|nr:MFS transporter [Halobacteriovoraceae bacterium]
MDNNENRDLVINKKIILWGYFFSNCFCFLFPLYVIILSEAGFSKTNIIVSQSVTLFCLSFLMPFIGRLLDKDCSIKILTCNFVIMLFATLLILSEDFKSELIFIIPILILTTSVIGLVTMRTLEGVVSRIKIKNAVLNNYVVQNLSMAVSATLIYILSFSNRNTLLVLDLITTLIFTLFLIYISSSRVKSIRKDNANESLFRETFYYFYKHKREVVGLILIFSVAFSHLSSFPMLYIENGIDPKHAMSILLFVNTITVIIFSRIQARLSIDIHKFKYLFVATLFLSIGHVLVPFYLKSISGIAITTFIWTIGEALVFPIFTLIILEKFSTSNGGLASGTKDMVVKLSLSLAPIFSFLIFKISIIDFSSLMGISPILGFVFVVSGQNKIQNVKFTEARSI